MSRPRLPELGKINFKVVAIVGGALLLVFTGNDRCDIDQFLSLSNKLK